MSYVYNITFVVAPHEKDRFYRWIRESALPSLAGGCHGVCDIRLLEVVEAGGEKPGPEHGVSVALHAEFPTEESARSWHDSSLPHALGDFNSKFAPHAAFFITLLESITL